MPEADMDNSPLNAFVCGDFNMELGSSESTSLLTGLIMSMQPGWTCHELRNYWFRAGENVTQFTAFYLDIETLDYFVAQFKQDPTPSFNTQIGIVNEMCRPQDALSDHQYEITSVTFPPKK